MKIPLRVGAFGAPRSRFPFNSALPQAGKVRRIANLSAATAMVLGVGAVSALFVNHLADRARAAEGPVVVVKPVAEKAVGISDITVASIAAQPLAQPPAQLLAEVAKPAPPPAAPIEAAMPDPVDLARVAADVGPEHAIELPTDDPTESPIVLSQEVAASDDALLAAYNGAAEERLAAYAEDDASDAALAAPDEPAATPKKPKTAKAKPAGNGAAAQGQTEVASLPGVDIGGLAGHSSGDDNSGSTVRTVTKPAASKNLGGVPAGAARVTAAVNMRSGPKKGAGVLTVVPAGSTVSVLSCDGWCQVDYNGRKGWVYKSFLAASNAKPQKAAKSTEATTDATTEAPPTRRIQSSRL